MRLTTDLIRQSYSFINTITERELDLRGHKIAAIENLGAALDNDAIDLTDNAIVQLGNFPLQVRLKTIFAAQNRIAAIQPNLSASIPSLTTIVLSNNRLAELADLEPLAGFKNLVFLSLTGNPVANKQHYRYWVVWLIPSLRYFDFAKVKASEKAKATELFGTREEPTALATQILGVKSKGFVVPTFADNAPRVANYTDAQKAAIQRLVQNATSLEEMVKLEKDVQEGRIPLHLLDGPEPMQT